MKDSIRSRSACAYSSRAGEPRRVDERKEFESDLSVVVLAKSVFLQRDRFYGRNVSFVSDSIPDAEIEAQIYDTLLEPSEHRGLLSAYPFSATLVEGDGPVKGWSTSDLSRCLRSR